MFTIRRSKSTEPPEPADVCLVLEGTYPYVAGGVASWTHELILNQPDLTFDVVTLLAPGASTALRYPLPKNLRSLFPITLQKLPAGRAFRRRDEEFLSELEPLLTNLQNKATEVDLLRIIDLIERNGPDLGSRVLLDSKAAWHLVQRMYNETLRAGSFVDFFWSWRSMFGGLFSVLLPKLPAATLYHTVCTGFAGLYASRASLETGRPMVLTEHGIYTNERRIELGVATWFKDIHPTDLSLHPKHIELRDLWIRTFSSYSRICYSRADKIVTLFGENQLIQQTEGADPRKQLVIVNGIDVPRFNKIRRSRNHPPTVALIGRVVPIKGIKTFIMACERLRLELKNLRALILGPYDEDPEYYEECRSLVQHLGLEEIVMFTGRVRLDAFLGEIDVMALTSVSEAQPLVILEAGAAGIPSVVTDVGACRELVLGTRDENPRLGPGGAVAKVADAIDVAQKLLPFLKDPALRARCGDVMRSRVRRFYSSVQQHTSYRKLYDELISKTEVRDELRLVS